MWHHFSKSSITTSHHINITSTSHHRHHICDVMWYIGRSQENTALEPSYGTPALSSLNARTAGQSCLLPTRLCEGAKGATGRAETFLTIVTWDASMAAGEARVWRRGSLLVWRLEISLSTYASNVNSSFADRASQVPFARASCKVQERFCSA